MARPPGSATDLMKMLNVATMPIYVLDEQRRIRFANVCLLEWVDAANDEVVGLRCDYHHDVELDSMLSLATGLCPPPEAFVGRASRAVVACQSRGGQLSRRWADCLPLAADEKGGRGVLVVVDRDEVSVEFDRNSSNGESADLHELVREFYHAEQGRFSLGQLAGTSSAIRKARAQVRLAVQAVANVMVVGPSGSGREHVARTIYHAEQYQVERQILLPVECGLVDGGNPSGNDSCLWAAGRRSGGTGPGDLVVTGGGEIITGSPTSSVGPVKRTWLQLAHSVDGS